MIIDDQDKEDLTTVVGFLYGWWPGLEDGISGWGSDDSLNNEPPIVAARRLVEKYPWMRR